MSALSGFTMVGNTEKYFVEIEVILKAGRNDMKKSSSRTLVICCGAMAREIIGITEANGWEHFDVSCLPAKLHNTPEVLPKFVRAKITEGRKIYNDIVVLYSDCGTGGEMQRMLSEEGVMGIGGAHCYEIFAGGDAFRDIVDNEPGCFFVTDFLARHFENWCSKGSVWIVIPS